MTSDDIGFRFTWKIKNFSLCSLKGDNYLKSPSFQIEMLCNSEWELWLYPNENSKVVVNILRLKNDKAPDEVTLNSKLSILRENRTNLTKVDSDLVFKKDYSLLNPLSVNVDDIFSSNKLLNTLVVQCHLWNSTTKSSIKCSAVTQISVQEYYASLPAYYHGIVFLSAAQVELNTISKTYPNFKICWKNSENVECNIHMTDFDSAIYVRCEISIRILNKTKKILFNGDYQFSAGIGDNVWTLSNIFQSVISDLKNYGSNPYIIDIKLIAADSSQNSCIKSIAYDWTKLKSKEAIQATSDCLLRKQLEKLRIEETLQDFTIKSIDREFKIHKTIFAAVSPVFRAMFEMDMSEKRDSIVSIEDVDLDILEKLTSYVYTEKVTDLEWNDVLKLYTAAEKYQIMELKQKCTEIMKSKLNLENIFDALVLADLHQDELLLKSAKQLINENAKQVFRSEEWNNFKQNNLKIACEVMHGMCIRFTESP